MEQRGEARFKGESTLKSREGRRRGSAPRLVSFPPPHASSPSNGRRDSQASHQAGGRNISALYAAGQGLEPRAPTSWRKICRARGRRRLRIRTAGAGRGRRPGAEQGRGCQKPRTHPNTPPNRSLSHGWFLRPFTGVKICMHVSAVRSLCLWRSDFMYTSFVRCAVDHLITLLPYFCFFMDHLRFVVLDTALPRR